MALVAAAGIWLGSVRADEGMWTFDNPPIKLLQERYGFAPGAEWFQHLRLSSVRFNDGGSGSFVSRTGLVLTNHHVALGQIQKLSSAEHNYVRDGFYAPTRGAELKCPDLELNVLMSLDNVTSLIAASIRPGMPEQEALTARREAMARLEKESLAATGLRSDVVQLYQGGEYWMYRYKKYTDVRLVFAPEQQAAFFGGDPDNFTFPRYDLDFAIVRAYENDQPVVADHFLKWSAHGAAAGDLVFVAGHPGSTDRLQTVEQLKTSRDLVLPTSIKVVKRRIGLLREYSQAGQEQARQASGLIFGLENAQKAWTGELQGLQDPRVMTKKEAEEREFRRLVESKPEWKAFAPAWDTIAKAELANRALLKPQRYRALRGSQLAGLATTFVKYAQELKKPDAQRLDGFHDAQLSSLLPRLTSPAPHYVTMDEALLGDSLQEALEELGADDPFITAVLAGRKAADVARDAMQNTKLADTAFRKELVTAGADAILQSADPLLVLARTAEPFARAVTREFEDKVVSVVTTAGEQIGQARFAVFGRSVYPDATFTLRLSYGTVQGYPMNGTLAPAITTFYGLFDRSASFGNKTPFDLPARVAARKSHIELSTPLNFVSSNDIIGGNSGSPVVNRAGELVGLIFDGNIESLVGRFVYSDEANRSVAVHSEAIVHVLRQIYDAGSLADELEAGAR